MATNDVKTPEKRKVVNASYTVDEFAQAPESLGAKSPDIVRAAFAVAGKEKATVSEAKKLVESFKNKEVK